MNHRIGKCACRRFWSRKVDFGLYPKQGPKLTIPLEDIRFKVDIRDALSTVEITQVYVNKNQNPVECEYRFPIDPMTMAATSLTVTIDDEVIEGKIMDKDKAEEKYNDEIARGNTVMKMNTETMEPDMIKLLVGNLLPEQKAKIVIKYIKLLEIEDNSWSFRIPVNYTPKYVQSGSSKAISKPGTYMTSGKLPYKWNLNISIKSSKEITRLVSLAHNIDTTFKEKNTHALIKLVAEDEVPDHDIVILYRTEAFDEPSVILQKSPEYDKYAALISFYPRFFDGEDGVSKVIDTDASKVYKNNNEEIVTGSGEYIFLLDCSGSMAGARIKLAVSALETFLRSLPVDSKFNIIRFGSDYHLFSEESLAYDTASLNKALMFIKKIDANLGGTEIDAALLAVMTMPSTDGYPRSIFLLTDGQVYNPDDTINIIRTNLFNTRVHTLGIGTGASRYLVKGCAMAGNGTFQFVVKNAEITPKVVESLAKASVPAFIKPSLIWPPGLNVSLQSPPEKRMPNVYMNEPFIVTAIVDKPGKDRTVSLQFQRTVDHKDVTLELELPDKTIEGKDIYQIAVKSAFANDVEITDEAMKELSIKYSVLSNVTAFVAVKKNKDKATAPMQHIDIPIPVDQGYKAKRARPTTGTKSVRKKVSMKCRTKATKCKVTASKRATRSRSPTRSLSKSKSRARSPVRKRSRSRSPARERSRGIGRGRGGSASRRRDRSENNEIARQRSRASRYDSVESMEVEDIEQMIESEGEPGSYMAIIKKQVLYGNWNWNNKTLNVLEIGEKEANNGIPKKLSDLGLEKKILLEVWVTILALAKLEVYFASDKQSWQMIFKKGIQWLRKQGVDYDTFKASAAKLIQ